MGQRTRSLLVCVMVAAVLAVRCELCTCGPDFMLAPKTILPTRTSPVADEASDAGLRYVFIENPEDVLRDVGCLGLIASYVTAMLYIGPLWVSLGCWLVSAGCFGVSELINSSFGTPAYIREKYEKKGPKMSSPHTPISSSVQGILSESPEESAFPKTAHSVQQLPAGSEAILLWLAQLNTNLATCRHDIEEQSGCLQRVSRIMNSVRLLDISDLEYVLEVFFCSEQDMALVARVQLREFRRQVVPLLEQTFILLWHLHDRLIDSVDLRLLQALTHASAPRYSVADLTDVVAYYSRVFFAFKSLAPKMRIQGRRVEYYAYEIGSDTEETKEFILLYQKVLKLEVQMHSLTRLTTAPGGLQQARIDALAGAVESAFFEARALLGLCPSKQGRGLGEIGDTLSGLRDRFYSFMSEFRVIICFEQSLAQSA